MSKLVKGICKDCNTKLTSANLDGALRAKGRKNKERYICYACWELRNMDIIHAKALKLKKQMEYKIQREIDKCHGRALLIDATKNKRAAVKYQREIDKLHETALKIDKALGKASIVEGVATVPTMGKLGVLDVVLDATDYKRLIMSGDGRELHYCNFKTGKTYIPYAVFRGKLLHSLIVEKACKEHVIDHIDQDSLNNTRRNLRSVSRSVNGFNSDKSTGVCWHKSSKGWQAHICKDGKRFFKIFGVRSQALKWRKNKSIELYGFTV